MAKYIIKRFLRAMITLVIILSIVFILLRQMPMEGYFKNYDKMSEAAIQNGIKQMGLDQPMYKQVFNFFKGLILNGDLGTSRVYRNNVPVADILFGPDAEESKALADAGRPVELEDRKVLISVMFGSMSLVLALLLGLPLGAFMARFKNRIPDHLGTAFIVFIEAVPAAVYYLYIWLFGTKILGVPMLFDIENWKCWILPVFSLSLGSIAYYGMWLRRYMVDESTKDYVQLAKIKGVSGSSIMFKHLFRNAFVPMVQYLPTSFLNTVIGSIYIESLYSIPGMGGLLVDVIKKQDNAMVQAIVLLFATVGIIGLILGDIMMVILDPRISFGAKGGNR